MGFHGILWWFNGIYGYIHGIKKPPEVDVFFWYLPTRIEVSPTIYIYVYIYIPSGKRLHNKLERSTMLFMGKFPINGDVP